jgi:hypothetical protein
MDSFSLLDIQVVSLRGRLLRFTCLSSGLGDKPRKGRNAPGAHQVFAHAIANFKYVPPQQQRADYTGSALAEQDLMHRK